MLSAEIALACVAAVRGREGSSGALIISATKVPELNEPQNQATMYSVL
jgi:hypothetical protein